MKDKKMLRAEIIARRDALAPAERNGGKAAIARRIAAILVSVSSNSSSGVESATIPPPA